MDVLLDRGHTSAAPSIHADEFCQFFSEKVAKIQAATDGAPLLCFPSVCSGISLCTFTPVSAANVVDAICRLPDKCLAADPIPAYVLKRISDIIVSFVAELFNCSVESDHFPAGFKEASVTPVMKKLGLDPTDASSYRPISNLLVLSKLLERIVVRQLMTYLMDADLPPLPSGFQPGHSTESAILRILSDILLAVDRGDFVALVLPDLSAAFDMVDHDILESSFGIANVARDWFLSYLSGRRQSVCCGGTWSSAIPRICGILQGYVLGPVLFILYVADLAVLVESHGLTPHQYADDTQIYGSCSPLHVDDLSLTLSGCVNNVADWMRSNRLQLDPGKTELL